VFLQASRIRTGATFAFERLRSGPLLADAETPETVFLDEMTDALDRINFLHPFREGNGRSQRAFLDQVAHLSGRQLTWRNATDEENRLASIASVTEGKVTLLREMMSKVIRPPDSGSPGFDIDAYQVPEPDTLGSSAGRGLPRCRRCGRPLRSEESIARGFGPGCWQRRYE